jgi:hypothetical protein
MDMEFNYEVLGDDGFQQLVQSLLTKEFSNIQCFPIGEPDGGRDALQWIWGDQGQGFIVYQVKFSRNYRQKTARSVILEGIRTEGRKLKALKEMGATKYVLVTNVRGSGKLVSGSIDQANREMSEKLGIPAQVFWRDDLDARVRADRDLKWAFPQMLKATDILPHLLAGDTLETAMMSIKGYMSAQYAAEKDVKFKQVEMRHGLLDLYVDLPVGLKSLPSDTKWSKTMELKLRRGNRQRLHEFAFEDVDVQVDSPSHFEQVSNTDVASIILGWNVLKQGGRLVLEGAPGQGKSTVTQYISQVHRLSFLNKDSDLRKLKPEHRLGAARVPFRVDLRDFAAWVNGYHPYAQRDGSEKSPVMESRSLETFLAMQVSWMSGGNNIDVKQLQQFFSKTHCLFVLDGFDEIADISTRTTVVEKICEASDRFENLCLSSLLIVTSRPAAFANSPGFPLESWVHMELQDLRASDIEEYRDKWSVAQGLAQDEDVALRDTLNEKLQYSHLRQLSRNPMQLSILLHLIHIQGSALPEKRTALYEKYIDLFFNREAEKSSIVRDHRDLILGIHGYVAWNIQVRTEKGESSGSVSAEYLRSVVSDYLTQGEHEGCSVDTLLLGMVERVVALVSRVEGTYEFEVQPIREYFAAKFLYSTAAYSPVGSAQSGSRPERLDALARSFYWTNVTRFFCGFYDVGELPALVHGLEQLMEDDQYGAINHPRSLALMLLSDWVFSQSPRCTRQLIESVIKTPNLFKLGAYPQLLKRGAERTKVNVPDTSGKKVLLENIIKILSDENDFSRRSFICSFISNYANDEEFVNNWMGTIAEKRIYNIIPETSCLGINGKLSLSDLRMICSDDLGVIVAYLVFYGRHNDVLKNEDLLEAAIQRILRIEMTRPSSTSEDVGFSFLDATFVAFDPLLFANKLDVNRFQTASVRKHEIEELKNIVNDSGAAAGDARSRVAPIVLGILNLISDVDLDWQHSLVPWRALLAEADRHGFANNTFFRRMALISAGVRSREEKGSWSEKGWSFSPDIVDCLRYARLRSGATLWWAGQLEEVMDKEERTIAIIMCCVWAGPKVLTELHSLLEECVQKVDERVWRYLLRELPIIVRASGEGVKNLDISIITEVLDGGSKRIACLLLSRLHPEHGKEVPNVYKEVANVEPQCGDRILTFALRLEMYKTTGFVGSLEAKRDVDWDAVLGFSKRLAKEDFLGYALGPFSKRHSFPDYVVEELITNSDEHLPEFVQLAEQAKSSSVASNARLVSEIAEHNRWKWF